MNHFCLKLYVWVGCSYSYLRLHWLVCNTVCSGDSLHVRVGFHKQKQRHSPENFPMLLNNLAWCTQTYCAMQGKQHKCENHVTTSSGLNKFQSGYFEVLPPEGVVEPQFFLHLHSELHLEIVNPTLCLNLDPSVVYIHIKMCASWSCFSHFWIGDVHTAFLTYVFNTLLFLKQEMVICGPLLCDGCVI